MQCASAWLAASNIVLSLAVGIFAGAIALRQWRTARNKLNFDMFEKRRPVYHAAMTYLVSVINNGDIPAGKEIEFLLPPKQTPCFLAQLSVQAPMRLDQLILRSIPSQSRCLRGSAKIQKTINQLRHLLLIDRARVSK